MDIRYLESLIAIAEQGSIAAAARVQHLTAAAVGQRVALLEQHFGVSLLDRSSRRAGPSEAGARLLPLARKIVGHFHEMETLLDPGGLTGSFSLGAIPTALTGILPRAIRRLARDLPQLALEIKPGTSETVFQDLSGRDVQAAVLALPPFDLPDRFTVRVIRREPLVLLSKRGSGRTRRERLLNNPYLCFDPQSWAGGGALRFLADEGIEVEPFYALDALEPIARLVQEGMGVSLVPYWAGLDREKGELDIDVIRGERYCRRIALVSPVDTTRPLIVAAIEGALLSAEKS